MRIQAVHLGQAPWYAHRYALGVTICDRARAQGLPAGEGVAARARAEISRRSGPQKILS